MRTSAVSASWSRRRCSAGTRSGPPTPNVALVQTTRGPDVKDVHLEAGLDFERRYVSRSEPIALLRSLPLSLRLAPVEGVNSQMRMAASGSGTDSARTVDTARGCRSSDSNWPFSFLVRHVTV